MKEVNQTRRQTRRGFVRMMGVGASVVATQGIASCYDGLNVPLPPAGPDAGGGGGTTVSNLSFDLRTDTGIFQLVHALEQLEAALYTAVVANSNFNTFFNADEREVFIDLRDAEVIHAAVVRTALGSSALPDLRPNINGATLTSILSSRTNILATARYFEHTGVAGLNGAGKYLQNTQNLLFAGKAASVEARHAAALRDIAAPSASNQNTAFAGDDIVDSNGLDVKLEAGAVIARVVSTNILIAGTLASNPISNAPTANQGVATADFFPNANP